MSKSFRGFKHFLSESLDSKVDYIITEDSKMPFSIYGAFTLDGIQYGMALVESTFKKVYVLRFYRINNKKPRLWAVKTPGHIRPIFSTLLDFVAKAVENSSITGLKQKMDGIIIEMPAKFDVQKYNKLINFMVRKNHAQEFRSVPVVHNKEKTYQFNYSFIVRKQVNPKVLFKSKQFSEYVLDAENMEFDKELVKQGQLPAEIAQNIVPKKIVKQTVSTKINKRFAMGKFELELDIDSQEVDDIIDEAIKSNQKIKYEIEETEQVKNPLVDLSFEPVSEADTLPETHSTVMIAYILNKMNTSVLRQAKYSIKDFRDGIIDKDLYESKKQYIEDKIENIIKNNSLYKYDFKNIDAIQEAGFIKLEDNSEYYYRFSSKIMDKAEKIAKDIFIHAEKISDYLVDYEEKYIPQSSPSQAKDNKYVELPIKLEARETQKYANSLESFVVRDSTSFSAMPFSSELLVNKKELDEVYQLKQELFYDKNRGFTRWIEKDNERPYEERYLRGIKNYTGNDYTEYNASLRGFAQSLMEEKSRGYFIETYFERGMKYDREKDEFSFNERNPLQTLEAFQKAPKLDEPLWVYRNLNLPFNLREELDKNLKIGYEYVDPGFFSTTIDSTMGFGYENGRMKIYLPKGTTCFPVLNASENDSESEVILPPMSVLKIVSFGKIERGHWMVAVYTGSAHKALYDAILKDLRNYMKSMQ